MADELLSICGIQKIVLYETKARFYLVGCNVSESKFRVLKMDRTTPYDLHVIDDKVEYDGNQIKQLLAMINGGNTPKNPKSYDKDTPGLHRNMSAFGVVGFIKFMEGYYIILISKRKKVAQIGGHTVYKIMDTCMVPIPNETVRSKHRHPSESKYLKAFQNVDLSSNFYFSYTYDVTQTLQYNMLLLNLDCSGCRRFSNDKSTGFKEEKAWEKRAQYYHMVNRRGIPCTKFIWNKHMIKDVENILHSDWLLYVSHGFVGQCNINVYGRPIYLTLIARRSNEYAGTRFLKRGSNQLGFVANDVETEQIVHDASTLSFKSGRYTSFVQLRGSVPLFWSQELQHGVVPKPQIQVDRSDPFVSAAAQHFNSILQRFGSPVIVFNLVKKKERKRHEQILGEEYTQIVDYLNQFLSPRHKIKYIWFDIARYSKNKNVNIIEKLEQFAEQFVQLVGFFHNGPNLYANEIRPHERWLKVGGHKNGQHLVEYSDRTGIVRVNCVDCLDRTNIAQFVVGKHILGLQLYTLGVIDKPVVNFECDAVRLLEDLYDDHGDTLAVQYGGSQLVHRINTYLKSAPWTSHSRDIYQTVRRYYSGAFTDSEKQQAINLFLGKFIPQENHLPLWEYPNDYHFHHLSNQNTDHQNEAARSYTKWFDDETVSTLPFPYLLVKNRAPKNLPEKDELDKTDCNDLFDDYYQPNELSLFNFLFSFNLHTTYRPALEMEPSPFVVRAAWSESAEEHRAKRATLHRSSSQEELSSDSDSSSSSDFYVFQNKKDSYSYKRGILFGDVFPSMKEYYGVEITEPKETSLMKYQSFVALELKAKNSGDRHIGYSWIEKDEQEIRQEYYDIWDSCQPSVASALSYKSYVDNSRSGLYTISSINKLKYRSFFVL
ncbi:polyphosphoinositide phosphatase-like [Xenia sp. Carnegie-2017]|uniref:polyphosphoinositide phosphatase-like n=1 Tax=Xenia sp. Carnegie-2017 TaxID=2897299 RepID=UPI001F04D05E|nr:polyphosphoinositide phosphatase-like [Xenia sp. Carnegie-2017]